MGGGGLNILPKKSWNVWNHDNIEKVRRDEAQHAAEQEAVQRRQRQVDSEYRVEELQRRKRRVERGASAGTDARHVNFFEAEERQHAERGANEHHEREQKLKEEQADKQEGFAKEGACTHFLTCSQTLVAYRECALGPFSGACCCLTDPKGPTKAARTRRPKSALLALVRQL